jgi:hypothetical protein
MVTIFIGIRAFFERVRFVVWKNMAKNNNGNGKTINSQAAMDKAVKNVCDTDILT